MAAYVSIRDSFGMTDFLVRTPALGAALAKSLADKPAVLMRGHGATVVGPSIQRTVSRSIFLAMNATLQQNAIALGGPITYLDPEETRLGGVEAPRAGEEVAMHGPRDSCAMIGIASV